MPRISAKIEGWLDEAIGKHGIGEGFEFDLTLVQFDEGDQKLPGILIVFFFPGAVANTVCHNHYVIKEPTGLTFGEVDEWVRLDVLPSLRRVRDEQTQVINEAAKVLAEGEVQETSS